MTTGTLYLIPTPLGPSDPASILPARVVEGASHLSHFVAENARSARAFLKNLPLQHPLQSLDIQELHVNTPVEQLPRLLSPLLSGHDLGLISEAGCPAVADPGAPLVALAHSHRLKVVPLVGPSSILLALMASGLCGQNFCFHGYLPVRPEAREHRIRELDRESRRIARTQIVIETPYRNRQMLETLSRTCAPDSRICVAVDLTLPGEHIETRRAADWLHAPWPELNRRPAVFLFLG